MKSKIFNLGWVAIEQGVRLVVGLTVMTMVARHLGPVMFGTYCYVLAIAAILVPIAKLGLDGLVMRDTARGERDSSFDVGNAFWLQCMSTLLCCAVLLAILSRGVQPEGVDGLVTLSAILLVASAPTQTFFSVLKGREALSEVSIIRSLILGLLGCAAVALVVLNAEMPAFISLRAAEGWLFGLVGFCLVVRGGAVRGGVVRGGKGGLAPRFSRKKVIDQLSSALPVVLFGLGTMIYMRIDQYMLAKMASGEELGHYGVAVRIMDVAQTVPVMLQSTLFAAMTRNFDRDPANYDRYLQRIFDVFSISSLCVAVPMVAGSVIAVPIIFGEAYAPAVPLIAIHAIGLPLLFNRVALGSVLTIRHWLWSGAVFAWLGAVVNVGCNFLLIPEYGAKGAAIATVIAMVTVTLGGIFVPRLKGCTIAILYSLEPVSAVLRLKRIYNPRELGAIWRKSP